MILKIESFSAPKLTHRNGYSTARKNIYSLPGADDLNLEEVFKIFCKSLHELNIYTNKVSVQYLSSDRSCWNSKSSIVVFIYFHLQN